MTYSEKLQQMHSAILAMAIDCINEKEVEAAHALLGFAVTLGALSETLANLVVLSFEFPEKAETPSPDRAHS